MTLKEELLEQRRLVEMEMRSLEDKWEAINERLDSLEVGE